MFLAPSRSFFLVLFLAGVMAMGGSFYLEHWVGLTPCTLCILQRYLLLGFCVTTLAGLAQGPGRLGTRLYALSALVFSLGGMAVAARQVVLLSAPKLGPPHLCRPGLDYLLDNMSLFQAFKLIFNGSWECYHINWTLFDLSVPEWSLLFFVAMSALALYPLMRPSGHF